MGGTHQQCDQQQTGLHKGARVVRREWRAGIMASRAMAVDLALRR